MPVETFKPATFECICLKSGTCCSVVIVRKRGSLVVLVSRISKTVGFAVSIALHK